MNYDYKNIPKFKGWVLQNFPFIEADFDALTNYELYCKVVEYLNQVIANNNLMVQNIEELNNWFNNLDLQEEVNNKLDEMAESGELEEIIAAYINTNSLLGFNTVADLKAAENLINGSFVKTLGYHYIGDLGGSTYKIRNITNDDIVDESEIIALHDQNLIAELIKENEARPEQYGAYGDNEHDDTNSLQACITKNKLIRLGTKKNYKVTNTITIPRSIMIKGAGQHSRIISYIETENRPIFYSEEDIQHFHFAEFYIDARNTQCVGFEFKNPYDDCSFENIFFDNFKKQSILLGSNSAISQSVLINNCIIYNSNDTGTNNISIETYKCYEMNLLNTKILNRKIHSVPNVLLHNCYDGNIQGCSFTNTSAAGLKLEGNCRYNRIIANTYENLSGSYSISLIGTDNNDSIEKTIVIESGTYYNAPAVIECSNEAEGTFIGMEASGGRRNISLNVSSGKVTSPYGNCSLSSQEGNLLTTGLNITNYNGAPRYKFYSNSSSNADYGLQLIDSNDSNRTFEFTHNHYGCTKANHKIMLKSPNGTIRYLGLSNSGELRLTTYDYE